jgi:phosphatidylglycerophosphate synthase
LWLLAVNLCLAVNWFGDSLDGTLARHRRRLRPRYGFYVDHMADAFGALCLLAGLGLSGYMSPAVAAALLIVYYLLSLHIYLATYTQGHFKISYGPIGGTELRLLLAAANLWVLFRPQATFLGSPMKLFDVIALFAVAGLVIVVAFSVARSVRELYEVERL